MRLRLTGASLLQPEPIWHQARSDIYELVPSKAGFAEAAKTVVEVGAAASVPVDLTLDDSGQSTNPDPQQPAEHEQEPERRAPPQPLDGIFP